MNYLSRLIVLLIMSISFTAPAVAAVVAVDVDGFCEVVAADDDDKKTDGDKKPEGDEEEEPDCD
jgi:hypothetical protein